MLLNINNLENNYIIIDMQIINLPNKEIDMFHAFFIIFSTNLLTM